MRGKSIKRIRDGNTLHHSRMFRLGIWRPIYLPHPQKTDWPTRNYAAWTFPRRAHEYWPDTVLIASATKYQLAQNKSTSYVTRFTLALRLRRLILDPTQAILSLLSDYKCPRLYSRFLFDELSSVPDSSILLVVDPGREPNRCRVTHDLTSREMINRCKHRSRLIRPWGEAVVLEGG